MCCEFGKRCLVAWIEREEWNASGGIQVAADSTKLIVCVVR